MNAVSGEYIKNVIPEVRILRVKSNDCGYTEDALRERLRGIGDVENKGMENKYLQQFENEKNLLSEEVKAEMERKVRVMIRYILENIRFEKMGLEVTTWNTVFFNVIIDKERYFHLELHTKDNEKDEEELFYAYYENNKMIDNGIGILENVLFVVGSIVVRGYERDAEGEQEYILASTSGSMSVVVEPYVIGYEHIEVLNRRDLDIICPTVTGSLELVGLLPKMNLTSVSDYNKKYGEPHRKWQSLTD